MDPSQRDAIAFSIRLLRLANNGATETEIMPFSELAKMVGQTKDRHNEQESLAEEVSDATRTKVLPKMLDRIRSGSNVRCRAMRDVILGFTVVLIVTLMATPMD